ncbi:hypothetical protein MVLG_00859 [Microbotryum lychnidis-dioicae p1A1 Lamole]|uniref:CFEM domain-containing protein n=1 Tax=Microbotryum lychnidis-dioicae (strain p1A1 Lamole / MvSl-1064) TaxID=683840 RepID=U5H0C4_USTV1|nr:hypothetical protein MVLG_00859 [Microbotryum lychnidis-dioicae p1A1 Lamole]|eukprot:KDE09146.1 hypothetical protein MVLG_00859 [Microbotryum lychnidis-dioicae p1A1 Lamole]
MVHFRLLALGLAASTASVALAADAVKSCVVTCRKQAYHNGGGCKWEDTNCVSCPNHEEKINASTQKQCQQAHKTPVAGKHGLDYQHKAKSADEHDHKHDHGHDDKDEHGHEGKRQDHGKHGRMPHARYNKHDGAVQHDHDHGHDDKDKHGHEDKYQGHGKHGHMPHTRYNKHGEAVSKHHGEHTGEPGHPGKQAAKPTPEQQGKPGVKPHAKHHDSSEPFNVPAGQHKFSKTPGPRDPFAPLPIPQGQGKHGAEPDSKHHHGEHEHDYRGNKPPKGFKPEFVHPFNLTTKPENPQRHNHKKGTPQPEGHGKTSAEAPHGAHAGDKAPGTPKEGYKKQLEKQPRPAPKSGEKGNPPAKSAAGHAAETPKGGVTAADSCEAKALRKSKCPENNLKCSCTSQVYHAWLLTCEATNTTAYEEAVPKYLDRCQKAGHPVPKGKQGSEPQPGAHAKAGKNPAGSSSTEQHPKEKYPAGGHPAAQSKGKQGSEPQPGAHGEAGKNPASSNSTGQHPAGGPPAALPKGKQGGEPQPGAQTEAGKNPAGFKPTEQGSKENEPAGGSAADSNYPACANPCISVAQEKSKSNCTTVECQCNDSMFRTQFKACVNQTCNQADYNKTMTVGIQDCNAANNSTTGGDGSNNDNPNSNTNAGTLPPSTPGVQQNKPSSAFGLRSSVGAVLTGAIGVAFATLL